MRVVHATCAWKSVTISCRGRAGDTWKYGSELAGRRRAEEEEEEEEGAGLE